MSTIAFGAVVAALVADRLVPWPPLDALAARVGTGPLVAVGAPLLTGVLAGGLVAVGLRVHPYAGAALAALALLAAMGFWPAVRLAAPSLDDHPARGIEALATALTRRLVVPLTVFVPIAWVSLPLAAGAVVGVGTFLAVAGPAFDPTLRLLGYLPVRIAALALAIVARDPDAPLRARRWVPSVDSPLGGWPTATMAAALGVRLETDDYAINEVGLSPSPEQRRYARQVVGRAAALLGVAFALLAWL